jgi:hypothetical protein
LACAVSQARASASVLNIAAGRFDGDMLMKRLNAV